MKRLITKSRFQKTANMLNKFKNDWTWVGTDFDGDIFYCWFNIKENNLYDLSKDELRELLDDIKDTDVINSAFEIGKAVPYMNRELNEYGIQLKLSADDLRIKRNEGLIEDEDTWLHDISHPISICVTVKKDIMNEIRSLYYS